MYICVHACFHPQDQCQDPRAPQDDEGQDALVQECGSGLRWRICSKTTGEFRVSCVEPGNPEAACLPRGLWVRQAERDAQERESARLSPLRLLCWSSTPASCASWSRRSTESFRQR